MKMKTKYSFMVASVLALICLTISNAQAQNARMGIKGGLNVSNLYVDNVDDENARIGFNVGVYGQILSTETFAIQPELLYSTKGAEFESDGLFDGTAKFNLNYLDLPVLAVFKLGESAEIHLGAYASYLLSANITYDSDLGSGDENLDRDNFNSFDYGLVGGFDLNFSAVQVGVRYNYGLAKIADGDAAEAIMGDSKNSNAQVYIAFNLNQK